MGGVRYARVMGRIFKPGVQLPPKGLLMQYERARIVALVLSLRRIVNAQTTLPPRQVVNAQTTLPPLPYEMIIEIVCATILTTPQYGMDPVRLFWWFWNRPPTHHMQTSIVDMRPEGAPIRRVVWDGSHSDLHRTYGHGYRHWGIVGNPERFPVPRDPADVPAMTWTDLAMVYIEFIAGSSMVHRMIDDDRKGAEGTAKWYPDDIDVFVETCNSVVRSPPCTRAALLCAHALTHLRSTQVLFERWLNAVFRRVTFKDGTTTYETSDWQLLHPPNRKDFKWTCGQLKFNAIIDGKDLTVFDLPAAATHTRPPFNTVYTTFNPTGPFVMYQVVPRLADVHEHWGTLVEVDDLTDAVLVDAAKRSAARIAKYRRRIKGLVVEADHAARVATLY